MTTLRRTGRLVAVPIGAIILAFLVGAVLLILSSPLVSGHLDVLLPLRTYGALIQGSLLSFNAIVDTVRSLNVDTAEGDWNSVAVCSDGSYGVEEGLICSFPVRARGGKWEIVKDVELNEFSKAKFDASVAETNGGKQDHVLARAELDKVSAEVMQLVGMLDGLNRYRFERDPQLLAAWESAKRVTSGPVISAREPAVRAMPGASASTSGLAIMRITSATVVV